MDLEAVMGVRTPCHSLSTSKRCNRANILAKCYGRWLGQNSKQNKLGRALGDVQIRMRLKVSSDRSEVRLSYIPAMFPLIVKPLIEMGSVSPSLFLFALLTGHPECCR
jgi:hypothetical protein